MGLETVEERVGGIERLKPVIVVITALKKFQRQPRCGVPDLRAESFESVDPTDDSDPLR